MASLVSSAALALAVRLTAVTAVALAGTVTRTWSWFPADSASTLPRSQVDVPSARPQPELNAAVLALAGVALTRITTSDTDADPSVVQAVIAHCAGFPRWTLDCVRTTLTHRLAGAVLALLAGCGVLAAASGWAQARDDSLPPGRELELAEEVAPADQPPPAEADGLADLDGLGEPEAGAWDGGAELVGDADGDGVAVGDGLGDAVARSVWHDWLVPAGA